MARIHARQLSHNQALTQIPIRLENLFVEQRSEFQPVSTKAYDETIAMGPEGKLSRLFLV